MLRIVFLIVFFVCVCQGRPAFSESDAEFDDAWEVCRNESGEYTGNEIVPACGIVLRNFDHMALEDALDIEFVALGKRGSAHVGLNQFSEAEDDFAAALKLRPEQAVPFAGMASVYYFQRKDPLALRYIERAIEIDEKVSLFWTLKAIINHEIGALDQAALDIERALNLNPYEGRSHAILAHLNVVQGRYVDAVSSYQSALDHGYNSPAVFSGAAWILATSDRQDVRWPSLARDSAEQYMDAAEQSPYGHDIGDTAIILSVVDAAEGKFRAAVERLEGALANADGPITEDDRHTIRGLLDLFRTESPINCPSMAQCVWAPHER